MFWVSEDKKSYIWTFIENATGYWIDYKVNGVVYSVTTKETYFDFTEKVQSIRVASMSGACVGEFSLWSNSSLPSGNK